MSGKQRQKMSGERDITTDRLDEVLQKAGSDREAEQLIKEYSVNPYETFAAYYSEYIHAHKLEISEIICRSNISKNYIYNIINGRRNPGRDKVIALCIGAGMSVREINRGLKIAGLGVLYAKNERDARIVVAVNRGIRNVIDINIMLEKQNQDILE